MKDDEMGKECSTDGIDENAYSIFVGEPEGKRPLELHILRRKIIVEFILGK
jgi:hypothetical protein